MGKCSLCSVVMGSRAYGFEKLGVWQDAKSLLVWIYRISNQFPKDEKYGLTSQMMREVISVSLNIAEGSSRTTSKEQSRFYTMAYSSLMEVLSQMLVVQDLGLIKQNSINAIRTEIEKALNKLNALRNAIKQYFFHE